MNFKLILILCMLQTLEVALSIKNGFECVKRKSGTCRAFNVSDEFNHFIDLQEFNYGDAGRISTIIEIDYIQNKFRYDHEKNKKTKEFNPDDNPVVEILFSKNKDPENSYRLVLGEKKNRLAYVDMHIVKLKQFIRQHNNYSPDLPLWPFAINVTFDYTVDKDNMTNTKLRVFTKNGDGFDEDTPFLESEEFYLIDVKYMSIRTLKKNVKLVGFFDCSTQYGHNCGTEKTQNVTDCRDKFSPVGSGDFHTFVDMSKFNRLGKKKSEKHLFAYDEIFAIYRRNNDNMHILFTTSDYERGTYVRITIGDIISVRVRTHNITSDEYFEKKAIKKGWSQAPSEPNFIRVNISSVSKQISIFNLDAADEEPILTMKLCNYFDEDTIQYMSATSNGFETVDLYYDCCRPGKLDNCHVYAKNHAKTKTDDKINTKAEIKSPELTFYDVGVNKSRTFLNTSQFDDLAKTSYLYENGTSTTDYCPYEIAGGIAYDIEEENEDEIEDEIEDEVEDEVEDVIVQDVEPPPQQYRYRGGCGKRRRRSSFNSALLGCLVG